MTIWRMRIASWVTKATDKHSEYVIFITFPLRQWLCERALMLRYTFIASLVAPLTPRSSTSMDMEWIDTAQYKDRGRALVIAVMNLRVP